MEDPQRLEDPTEQRIREAIAAEEFADPPEAGKPRPSAARLHEPGWWAKG